MSKPRATTIQQRFGFRDDDLKKPDHDTIMFWLDEHVQEFIKHQFWFPNWRKDTIDFCKKEAASNGWSIDISIPPKPLPGEIAIIWEKPVMDRKYIIGFIDMEVVVKLPVLYLNDKGWQISYIDHGIHFEVKTAIPSLGELIRQIRMYQTYTRNGKFVIVSPDDRFKSALKSQGILFYKYDGDPLDSLMR